MTLMNTFLRLTKAEGLEEQIMSAFTGIVLSWNMITLRTQYSWCHQHRAYTN